MLGFLARLFFTTTAVAPVGLVYAFAFLFEGKFLVAGTISIGVIALVFVAFRFIVYCRSTLQGLTQNITSAETADQENVAFLLLYITPLFTSQTGDMNFVMLAIVGVVFIAVVMAGNNYHFNPLLNLLGWHFYKIDTPDNVKRILISRRDIVNVRDEVTVITLTSYVLLEKE